MSELEKAFLTQLFFSWDFFYSLYKNDDPRDEENYARFLIRPALDTLIDNMNTLRDGLGIELNEEEEEEKKESE